MTSRSHCGRVARAEQPFALDDDRFEFNPQRGGWRALALESLGRCADHARNHLSHETHASSERDRAISARVFDCTCRHSSRSRVLSAMAIAVARTES